VRQVVVARRAVDPNEAASDSVPSDP